MGEMCNHTIGMKLKRKKKSKKIEHNLFHNTIAEMLMIQLHFTSGALETTASAGNCIVEKLASKELWPGG